MIITKAPFRMSFFGGGTDMPEFFNEHGGAVLSTTFDTSSDVMFSNMGGAINCSLFYYPAGLENACGRYQMTQGQNNT
jgi:galactokinase/mevalonate kinase-like predicted kinase